MTKLTATLLMAGAMAMAPRTALAVPTLQLYSPQATYDTTSESWLAAGNDFTLQAIGASSPGWAERIINLKLYISTPVGQYDPAGSIHIAGSSPDLAIDLILGAGGLAPAGAPGNPFGNRSHGIYPAYYWTVDLPDMLVSPSSTLVRDFTSEGGGWDTGAIQEYDIAFSRFRDLHFDLSGTVLGGSHSQDVFAPFSHDADAHWNGFPPEPPAGDATVPEPATVALLGLGLTGVVALRMRRHPRPSAELK